MSEVLLLAVRFDDDEAPVTGAVTVRHPSGRRFVVAEVTDAAADPTDAQTSIW